MTPSYFVIFFKGYFLQISLGLEVVLDFSFTKFGGLSHVRAVFYHDWLVLVSPDLDGWVA